MASSRRKDESREALLPSGASPTRSSLDGSDATELQSLAGEDPLDDDFKDCSVAHAYSKPRPPPSLFRRLLPSRTSIIITAILLVGIIGLLFSGGFYAYHVRPPDGQSPPWYPTPRGGTAAEWAESYKKAAAMVRKMTLAEKVNVTTGVGWASDRCVGNTGPAWGAGFPPLVSFHFKPLPLLHANHSIVSPRLAPRAPLC